MKKTLRLLLAILSLGTAAQKIEAQGSTAFVYQGQLRLLGTNASGAFPMKFYLLGTNYQGYFYAGTSPQSALVQVANGAFSVNLDFGPGAFDGGSRWLQMWIQYGTNYLELAPFTPISAAPYALYAGAAATLANGTWSSSVGPFMSYTNVLGIYNNGNLALALANGGVLFNSGMQVNGNINATGLNFNTASISDDSQGGINLNGSVSASNLVLHGSSIQFPAQSGASVTVNAAGDFIFDNNVRMTSLGTIVLANAANATIFGANNGVHITGGLQENGDVSVFGAAGISGDLRVNGTIYGTLNQSSDRNLKEQLAPVDAREILARVAALPISRWNYKADAQTRHLGPMAQDFYREFQIGTDERHIATVDEGGVALAAIQGLAEKLKDKDAKIDELEKRLAALEKALSANPAHEAGIAR